MCRVLFMLLCLCSHVVHADAIPQDLVLTVRQGPLLCCMPGTIAIELVIKNTSGHSASIIVPGHPTKGMHLFDVVVYDRKPENMKWSYVKNLYPIDSANLTENKKHETFWRLRPGEEFKQLLFIKKPAHEHWAVQVRYTPILSDLYRHAFVTYDEEGTPDSMVNLTTYPDLLKAQGAFYSNLFVLLANTAAAPAPQNRVERAIYNRQNDKLLRLLRHGKELPKEWPVLSTQLYSQSILASLPSFSFQYLTVDTRYGVQHLHLRYRLGKIYRFRSRMASVAHMLGARRVFWKTSDADKTRLLSLVDVE